MFLIKLQELGGKIPSSRKYWTKKQIIFAAVAVVVTVVAVAVVAAAVVAVVAADVAGVVAVVAADVAFKSWDWALRPTRSNFILQGFHLNVLP